MGKYLIRGRLVKPVVETEHVVMLDGPEAKLVEQLLNDYDPHTPNADVDARLLAVLEGAQSHREKVVQAKHANYYAIEPLAAPTFPKGTRVREKNGSPHQWWTVASVRDSDHKLRLIGPGQTRGVSFREAADMEIVP